MNPSSLRILITGATGCAGTHLSALALARGAQVYGVAHAGAFVPGVIGQIGDLTQRAVIDQILADTQPDWIFHLAAIFPGAAGDISPERMIQVNVTGTFNVLDAVRQLRPEARVLVISSSAVYGQPAQTDQPITETAVLQPHSLYGTTKVAQEMLAIQFFVENELHTIRARTFNQTGPREPANLVCATLARQIARIEQGLQEPILRAVTLVPRRDFTDVRDVVAGYWAALEFGEPGQAYNICSERSESIRRIADILLASSVRRDIQIVETNPTPSARAVLNQIGDAARLRVRSGWHPRIPIETSLRDLLDEWRARGD